MDKTMTSREHQIARLLCDGRSVREIASALSLSRHTIDGHIRLLAARLPGDGKPIRKIVAWYARESRAA